MNEKLEKLYYIDEDGVEREASPSFMWGCPGGEGTVIASPICRACKNQTINKNGEEYLLGCKVKGEQPDELIWGGVYYCDSFDGDESYYHYDLVMREIKEYKETGKFDDKKYAEEILKL